MYLVETTKDGKVFRPLFVSGRIRLYTNLNNAKNGAKQILRNQKNRISMIKIVNKDNTKEPAVYIRRTDNGYEESMEEQSKQEIASKKEAVIDKVDNKIPLDSLIVKSKSVNHNPSLSKDKRLELLKESHDKWKLKRENPTNIKRGDSLNNISDNHSVKQVNIFYASLMESMLTEAISANNPGKLFRLEVLLSQGGYSWYYKDDKILVDITENVVNKLKDLDLVIED